MTMFPAQPKLVKQKQQHQQNYVYDARWTTTLSTSNSCRLVDEGLCNNNTSTSNPSINPLISRDQDQLVLSTMGDQDEDPDHSATNSSTNETGGSTTSNTNFIFDYTKQPKPQHITDDDDDDDGGGSGWLRLGMGMANSCQPRSSPCHLLHHNQTNNSVGSGGLMLELNLLPASISSTTLSFQQPQQQTTTPSTSSSSAFMVYQPPQVVQDQAAGWASYLRNPKVLSAAAAAAVASSSNSSLLQLQPPQPQPDIRFIRPPRRPHSGIWFMLLPSFNQVTKQPSLPQLPKNYLRIKDGRMTVGLLIKYLVNKLGLDTESQVEIRCRGMELEGSLTMQHVRDRIWTGSASSSSYPVAAAAAAHHHIMLLHYATRTTSTSIT